MPDAEQTPFIAKDQCVVRGIYELDSRNLAVGVWTGESFLGVRAKFDSQFIAREYHWNDGPPFGTAKPLKQLGMLPAEIPLEGNPLLFQAVEQARIDMVRKRFPNLQKEGL
jgi:hypothetical protein